MEEKKKQSDFFIKMAFQNWLSLQSNQKVVYLFGSTGIGKTTVGHLLKKFIDDDPNPNLKLVEKKKDYEYEWQGQINSKSMKPLTIYPKKFQIKSKNITIVQVPSRIYSLQKKRPFLDKILNVVGLAHAYKQSCFLFMVDAKNTSDRCELCKKCFQHILDCFSSQYLNEKTFNSIGFIICKGANSINKQVYLNRIRGFQNLFVQQQRKKQYLSLLNTILNQKNICVFPKATQNQQITKKEIQQIFDLIQKLSKNSVPLENQHNQKNKLIAIQPVELDKQEGNCLKSFNSILEIIFEFFAKFFESLFNSSQPLSILNFKLKASSEKGALGTLQSKQPFLKSIWPTDLNAQLTKIQILSKKFQILLEKSSKNKNFYNSPIGKASLIINFKQKILDVKKNNNTVNQFLQILADHGLIQQIDSNLPELEGLYLKLIEFGIFEERFGPIIKNIDYKETLKEKGVSRQFKDTNIASVQKAIHSEYLNKKLSLQINSEQATKYAQIVQKFFPKNQINKQYQKSIVLLKKNLLLKSLDENEPEKSILKIDALLDKIYEDKVVETIQSIQNKHTDIQKNQIHFLSILALKVARILQKCGKSDLCPQIFEDCGDFHSACLCYKQRLRKLKERQQKQTQIIETINSYINLLILMQLFEKALSQCYELGEIFEKIRPWINKKRNQIKEQRSKQHDKAKQKQFQQRFLKNFSNIPRFYLKKNPLSEIKKIAQNFRK